MSQGPSPPLGADGFFLAFLAAKTCDFNPRQASPRLATRRIRERGQCALVRAGDIGGSSSYQGPQAAVTLLLGVSSTNRKSCLIRAGAVAAGGLLGGAIWGVIPGSVVLKGDSLAFLESF